MVKSETKIRVRYGETDQMGYVYYGVYAQYYEVGRVEALRLLGFSYKEIEQKGLLMPVIDFSISYKKPAYYDDEITVITFIREKPNGYRFNFEYVCYNSSNELLYTGMVTLVMLEKATNKMAKIPEWFENALNRFFLP